MLRAINLERVGEVEVTEAADAALQHQASAKNPTWAAFTQYCKEHEVTRLEQLEQGPKWLLKKLGDDEWQQKIGRHLNNRQYAAKKEKAIMPPVYANKRALAKMEKAHEPSIALLKEFLAGLDSLKYARALDVAGGDGRVVKELLLGLFEAVDLFDHCPKALNKVEQLKALFPKLEHVKRAKMQEYKFKEKYSLILMCWCSGYLNDEELAVFLIRA